MLFCRYPIWSHCGTQSTAWKSYNVTGFYCTATILYINMVALSCTTLCDAPNQFTRRGTMSRDFTAQLHYTRRYAAEQTINLSVEELQCQKFLLQSYTRLHCHILHSAEQTINLVEELQCQKFFIAELHYNTLHYTVPHCTLHSYTRLHAAEQTFNLVKELQCQKFLLHSYTTPHYTLQSKQSTWWKKRLSVPRHFPLLSYSLLLSCLIYTLSDLFGRRFCKFCFYIEEM